jgi:hypothetical protein
MSTGQSNNTNNLTLLMGALGVMVAAIGILASASNPTMLHLFISWFLLLILITVGLLTYKEHKLIALISFCFCLFVGTYVGYLMWDQPWKEKISVPPTIVSAEEHFKRGENFYKQENYWDALSEFNEAQHLNPDFMQAIKYSGKCLLKLERFKEAEDVLQKVLAMAPIEVNDDMASLYAQWALYWCQNGNSREALRCIHLAGKFSRIVFEKFIGRIGDC